MVFCSSLLVISSRLMILSIIYMLLTHIFFFYNLHLFLNSNITYLTVYLTLSLGYPTLHTITSLKLNSWLPPVPSLIVCLSYPSKSLLLLPSFLGQNPISIFLPHASYISKFSQICFHNMWWKNLTSSYNLLSTPDPNIYQLSPGLLQLFPVSAYISHTTTCCSLPPMQQVIRMIILRHGTYYSSHQQYFPSPLKSIINYLSLVSLAITQSKRKKKKTQDHLALYNFHQFICYHFLLTSVLATWASSLYLEHTGPTQASGH